MALVLILINSKKASCCLSVGKRKRPDLSQSASAFAKFMIWPLQLFECNLLYLTRSFHNTNDIKITFHYFQITEWSAHLLLICKNFKSWSFKSICQIFPCTKITVNIQFHKYSVLSTHSVLQWGLILMLITANVASSHNPQAEMRKLQRYSQPASFKSHTPRFFSFSNLLS